MTTLVGAARRSFERPPWDHRDRQVWAWHLYSEPRYVDSAPETARQFLGHPIRIADNGVPLRPPNLWILPEGHRPFWPAAV